MQGLTQISGLRMSSCYASDDADEEDVQLNSQGQPCFPETAFNSALAQLVQVRQRCDNAGRGGSSAA